MPDSPYLKILRKSLKLCVDSLGVISNSKDRAEVERHIVSVRANINKIEAFDRRQERVRCGMENKI